MCLRQLTNVPKAARTYVPKAALRNIHVPKAVTIPVLNNVSMLQKKLSVEQR